jgi:hypothetical protein
VPSFTKTDSGLYCVEIITGARSVYLRLELQGERTQLPQVRPLVPGGLYRSADVETVRARVLEGTDEANREFGTAFHPSVIRYAVEDFHAECPMLRWAARAIVGRLAQLGESGYVAPWG